MYSTDAAKARALAERLHANQTDKAGRPYLGHLSRVAAGVDTDEARVVAWLHDSVEDTGLTVEDVAEAFGPDTAHAVDCMTHRAGDGYEAYLARVKTDPVARLVKISDLTDNSNLSRLPAVTLRDVARQAKYNRALRYMMTCCTLLEDDAQTAGEGMAVETVKDYGDDKHLFDDGWRRLLRCKKCGCLMLAQHSEFHGFDDDDYYTDYYPVACAAEADRINDECGPLGIGGAVSGRFLRRTNGRYTWSE